MNLDLISALVFYLIIGVIIYKKRHKIEFMGRFVPVYKTQRLTKFMRGLSSFGFFWKAFSTIAIPAAIFLMILILQMLFVNAWDIMTNPQASPAVGLLIPGVRIPGSPIYVPFWYGIIAIIVLVIVHEFTHGTVALTEDVKIKSSGVGMFLIFPIAFVEMDENSMAGASRLSRLRVITSASVANFFFAIAILYLMLFTINPFIDGVTTSAGVAVTSVVPGFPAEEAGITEGMLIYMIDNQTIENITHIVDLMRERDAGDTVTVSTDSGDFVMILGQDPQDDSKGYMGIFFENRWDFKQEALNVYGLILLNILVFLWFTLSWIANLNMMVGIMNLLPLWMIDGGQLVFNIFGYFMSDEKAAKICDLIFYAVLMVLLINIIGPYLL